MLPDWNALLTSSWAHWVHLELRRPARRQRTWKHKGARKTFVRLKNEWQHSSERSTRFAMPWKSSRGSVSKEMPRRISDHRTHGTNWSYDNPRRWTSDW